MQKIITYEYLNYLVMKNSFFQDVFKRAQEFAGSYNGWIASSSKMCEDTNRALVGTVPLEPPARASTRPSTTHTEYRLEGDHGPAREDLYH